MINLEKEDFITFAEAARSAVRGRRFNICTPHRWRTKGVRGVKLESTTHHFPGSERTARLYMWLSIHRAELTESKTADFAILTIEAAVKLLSKSKPIELPAPPEPTTAVANTEPPAPADIPPAVEKPIPPAATTQPPAPAPATFRTNSTKFVPQEIEARPARREPPRRNGAPEVQRQLRKRVRKAFGQLVRAFDAAGIGDEFHACTEQMAKRLKTL
jgi:hypothetical protein